MQPSTHWRPSRRRLLGLAGLAAVTAGTTRWRPVKAGDPGVSSHRVEVTFPDRSTSPVYRVPAPFDAVGVFWWGSADAVEIRTGRDGHFGPWIVAHAHPNGGPPRSDGARFAELIATPGQTQVQVRLVAGTVDRLACELINAGTFQARTPRASIMPVSLRTDWGCDEQLRYENGEVVWPIEYRPVEKVIVHHTVSANDETDWSRVVRSIYYYHAITQGFGDIGYNILIDPNGRIYEGRYGGPGVVGGHTLGYNAGSVGIAFLGSFSGSYLTAEAEAAFARIVSTNFGGLSPFGSSFFNDRVLPTVCGHRDCIQTECPGGFGYRQLANLRDSLGRAESRPRAQPQLEAVRFTRLASVGEPLRVDIDVWNNSTAVIKTQGPEPGFTYEEGQNSASVGHAGTNDSWRVGIDVLDNTTGKLYPYRWGLGKSLGPGERATVTGFIRVKRPRATQWWAGLIQEGIAHRIEWFGASLVQVLPGPHRLYLPAIGRQTTLSPTFDPDD